MMLGNLIKMEYALFPGVKQANVVASGDQAAANGAKKGRAAAVGEQATALKNVGGQELGGTGEEVERVEGAGCEPFPSVGLLDGGNVAPLEQMQSNRSRILNRFLRVGQQNGDQIVLQVKTPYVCLLQKVQVEASPLFGRGSETAAAQGSKVAQPLLPDHFKDVKNAADPNADENCSGRRAALSITSVQSFDIWGEAQAARTFQQSRQEVVSGPLGSIQTQNQTQSNWIVLYDDQSKQDLQARSFSGRDFQQAPDAQGQAPPSSAAEPLILTRECHGISDTFRVTISLNSGAKRPSQGSISAIEVIKSVTLCVHPCFKMPSASALMPLLNLCNLFSSENRPAGEQLEIEIISAQSLIAARKFIQAIEKLRKIQSQLLSDRQLQSKLSGRVDLRNLAIQLEILCADCMNQHSLQAEKMDSYRRIIELSRNFASVKPIVANNGFPRCQRQIRDYKIVEQLIEMNPQLMQIMKGCLFSNIESVRSACLKHIEYIFDNIGCSIGNAYIPRAIQALIFTYPKNNSCNFVKRPPPDEFSLFQEMPQQFNPICLDSFTKHYHTSVQIGLSAKNLDLIEELFQPPLSAHHAQDRFQPSSLPVDDYGVNLFQNRQLSSSSLLSQIDQVSIYRLYSEEIQISDAAQLHQNQLLYLKNHYNHILESILQLINSTSSFLLRQVFEQVLQHQIFLGPYDTIRGMQPSKQLSTDLRVYLIKMSDKIMNICEGDVKIEQKFLNDLIKTMIPTLIVTKEQIQLENQQSKENNVFGIQEMVDDSGFVQVCGGHQGFAARARQVQPLDEQSLLKNPGLIVSDIVKLACENLWNTIRKKVLLRYSLASSQMQFLLNWVNTNLQSLSHIIESADDEGQAAKDKPTSSSRKQLTQGHMAFLNQNLELIGDICQLQLSHIQQVKPRLTQSQRMQRRLALKAAKRMNKKLNLGAILQNTFAGRNNQEAQDVQGEGDGRVFGDLPGQANIHFQSEGFVDLQENLNGNLMAGAEGQFHLNNTINGQIMLSQNINNSIGENVYYINQFYHPELLNQGYDGGEVFNNEMALMQNNMLNNYIPDNVTDLDLQNQLVDSIQDEFEDLNQNEIDSNTQSQRAASLNSKLKAEEQDLLMGSHRLSDIFNRQRKLEILDQGGEQARGLVIDHNQRLIKVPTSYIVQGGIIQLIQPLIYWLGYTLRTRDMLGLFKKIWSLLKLIIQKCAARSKIKIDLIKIIFPHLQKVKEVCKDTSPSLEMLNFLKFVLIDIRPKDVRKNKVLRDFLLDFLMVLCEQIPHNLHDEIFQICKDVMELTKHSLSRAHIEQIINSLVDKYTMRSKAYKNVLRYFLRTCIQLSQKQIAKAMSQDSVQRFVLQRLKEQGLLQVVANDAAVGQENATRSPQQMQGAGQTRNGPENIANMRQEGRGAAQGRNGRREGRGGFESSISISHSQIENNVNNNQNNAAVAADLVSTSQDDLDNYVYEDQESGTHVLDDDIDDHDFTNLRRQNQINNEYIQNQHRRQNHFRERTQHMNNQNHRQRQERMFQRQRQDRERHRGSDLFFQENQEGMQSNDIPQSAPQVPYSQVQDSNRPEIQRQAQQQIMQSAPHETARQLQAQASQQQQHYRLTEAQMHEQAEARRGAVAEHTEQRQRQQEQQQRYNRPGDANRPTRSARLDRAGQRQRHSMEEDGRHPQLKGIQQMEAELLAQYKDKVEKLDTPFDIICDICLFSNKVPPVFNKQPADSSPAQRMENSRNAKNQSFSEIEIQEEIFSEKLDIIQIMFKELGPANVELFKRFLRIVESQETLSQLFSHSEQSHQKIIKFTLDLANYYRTHIKTLRVNKYQVQYQSMMQGAGAPITTANPTQHHHIGVEERIQVITGLQHANTSHAPGRQGPYQSILEGDMNNDQVLRRSVGPGFPRDNRPLEVQAQYRQSQRSIPPHGMDSGDNPRSLAGNQLNNNGGAGTNNNMERPQQEANEFTGEGQGHTGHSDFFLRRQSHPANNNHDSNSLVQQPAEPESQNLREAIFRSNQSRNARDRHQVRNQAARPLIPRQQITTMNLNHSHNSLMFQNHLRGLGMMNQMSQYQQRPHLRSQHQSVQHSNELQPLLVNNLMGETANMNNGGHIPPQQMQMQDPNGIVDGIGGVVGPQHIHQQHFIHQQYNHNVHAMGQMAGGGAGNMMQHMNQQATLDLQGQVVIDRVETLCQSRLILVKVFSQIIEKLIDEAGAPGERDQHHSPPSQSIRKPRYVQNPHAQQQALHLILFMQTFLLPQPTLVNQMVQMYKCKQKSNGQLAAAGRNFELKLVESQERIIEGDGLRTSNGLQQQHPACASTEADDALRSSEDLQAMIGFTLRQLKQAKALTIRRDQSNQSRYAEYGQRHQESRVGEQADGVTAAQFSSFKISKKMVDENPQRSLRGGNDLQDGTESTNLHYLVSLLSFCLKIWPFIEGTMLNSAGKQTPTRQSQMQQMQSSFLGSAFQSSSKTQEREIPSAWVTQKYLCAKILQRMALLFNWPGQAGIAEPQNQFDNSPHHVETKRLEELMGGYQQKFHAVVLPLVNKLIQSENTEDTAIGLNVLASLCGLTRDSIISIMEENDNNGSLSNVNEIQRLLQSPQRMKRLIFMPSGSKISITIWQEVFDILESKDSKGGRGQYQKQQNEIILREAASILIQLAAPRDSIYHFLKIAFEQSNIQKGKIVSILDYLNIDRQLDQGLPRSQARLQDKDDSSVDYSDSGELNSSDSSHSGDMLFSYPSSPQTNQQSQMMNQANQQNQDTLDFNKHVLNYFYMDKYTDTQLKQVISFFEDEIQKQLGNTMVNEGPGAYQQFGGQFRQNFQTTTNSAASYNYQVRDQISTHNQKGITDSAHGTDQQQMKDSFDRSDHMAAALNNRQPDFQSEDQNSIMQLQNLWIDRGKQATGMGAASSSLQNFYGDHVDRDRAASYRVDYGKAAHLKSSADLFGHGGRLSQYLSYEAPIFDGFEDQIIQGLNNKHGVRNHARQRNRGAGINSSENDESDFLIFERHFDKNGRSNPSNYDDFNEQPEDGDHREHGQTNGNYLYDRAHRNDQSPSDDLGIIDLDNDEDEEDDLFDVDDDKLPILKNIISKKNRPNNGKSVAIGSRSQGGIMKIRAHGEQSYNNKKYRQGSGKMQASRNQSKGKNQLQKPNSAQRTRAKGSIQKHKNYQIKQTSSAMQHCDEDKPRVIYDEDNLICDEFLTGRQRPQSGRVSRQRPLSGIITRINPMHPRNQRVSKEYNNQYMFSSLEKSQQMMNLHTGQNKILKKAKNYLGSSTQYTQAPPVQQQRPNNGSMATVNSKRQQQLQGRPVSSNNVQQTKNLGPSHQNRGSPQVVQQHRRGTGASLHHQGQPDDNQGARNAAIGPSFTSASCTTINGPLNELRQQHRPADLLNHPQNKIRGPAASRPFGDDLKIQNSSLNHSVLVSQTLFNMDNDDYDRQKLEQYDKIVDQFESKIANSIDQIFKKMQRQQIIKSLPSDAMYTVKPGGQPMPQAATAIHQEVTRSQTTLMIDQPRPQDIESVPQRQADISELSKEAAKEENQQASIQTDEGRLELTPIRRNSEDMNDLGTFVPSPQELYQRLNSNKEPSNPSNVSESELLVATSVSQPASVQIEPQHQDQAVEQKHDGENDVKEPDPQNEK